MRSGDDTSIMSHRQQAMELLQETSWFHDASESLLDALASSMFPIAVEEGHIFVEEGQEIFNVLILEEGTLVRSKVVADEVEHVMEVHDSMRSLSTGDRAEALIARSVKVDELVGRGRISGMLHNMKEGSKAYATVMVAHGPAKVWLISGDDFRDIISGSPTHSLEVLSALSREIRVGSKSLRGLIHKLKDGHSAHGRKHDAKVLRVLCYDSTSWTTELFKPAVEAYNESLGDDGVAIEMEFSTERLGERSATYAAGFQVVCLFVNDNADAKVIQTLSLLGVQMIAMRCAGFDRVDTDAARVYGVTVARVPAYSPYAVAEMAVALLMTVNRRVAKASNRVKMANFTLDSGLMGMDIHGKTVGVMGTGKIGQILCNIMLGFGAKLICYDVYENDDIKSKGGTYVTKDEIFAQSDVLFLMMPMLPSTHHTINHAMLKKLKRGVLIINTSRGGLVDAKALLEGLQSGIIGGVGTDVYEYEQAYFFQDWSAREVQDPVLVALLGSNNVVLTAHQAFFTKEAVDKIVSTTLENVRDFGTGMTGKSHPNNCIPTS